MWTYALRRLLYAVPVLLGVTLITFTLFHVAGGDPARSMAGKNASEEKLEKIREDYGLDEPLHVQYLGFLEEVVTFDFKKSFRTHQTVGSMIWEGVGPSLALAVPAFLLASLISIALGLFCAYHRGSIADVLTRTVSVAAMSISSLAYVILGQYLLAFKWRLFPVHGFEWSIAGIAFLVLPATIWILLSVGTDVRFYRAVMLEEMRADYVRTAASKGLSTRRILFRHILRNSLIPIITRLVLSIPFLFLGSLLLESFFGIPGLGALTVTAIDSNDWPVVKAMVVIGALLYIVGVLISDLLYAAVDPRVRLK
jgi:peptide/nickel transport system permease protein